MICVGTRQRWLRSSPEAGGRCRRTCPERWNRTGGGCSASSTGMSRWWFRDGAALTCTPPSRSSGAGPGSGPHLGSGPELRSLTRPPYPRPPCLRRPPCPILFRPFLSPRPASHCCLFRRVPFPPLRTLLYGPLRTLLYGRPPGPDGQMAGRCLAESPGALRIGVLLGCPATWGLPKGSIASWGVLVLASSDSEARSLSRHPSDGAGSPHF
jgi:hypothetical protein